MSPENQVEDTQEGSRRQPAWPAWLAFTGLLVVGWLCVALAVAFQFDPPDPIKADGVSSFLIAVALTFWLFAWWSIRRATFESRMPLLVLVFTALMVALPAMAVAWLAFKLGSGDSDDSSGPLVVGASMLFPILILISLRASALARAGVIGWSPGPLRSFALIATVIMVSLGVYAGVNSDDRPYAMDEIYRTIEDREIAQKAPPPHPLKWWSTLANKGADMQAYLATDRSDFPDMSEPEVITQHDHFRVWTAAPVGAMLTGDSYGNRTLVLAGYEGTWLLTDFARDQIGTTETVLACRGTNCDRFVPWIDGWEARDTGDEGCSSSRRRRNEWCRMVPRGEYLVPRYNSLDDDIARRADRAIRLAEVRAIVKTPQGVKLASTTSNVEPRRESTDQ